MVAFTPEDPKVFCNKIDQCRQCDIRNHYPNSLPTYPLGTIWNATVIFIAEAPGEEESIKGKPLIGKAGKLFQSCLIEAGFTSTDGLYITNAVKHRPLNNKTPSEENIIACSSLLREELAQCQTDQAIICCLGNTAGIAVSHAFDYVFTDIPMKSRCKTVSYAGPAKQFEVHYTWHPAYILRNPSAKHELIEDLQKINTIRNNRNFIPIWL